MACSKKVGEKKRKLAQTGLEHARAGCTAWDRDTELNHKTIWTAAQLWLLCFDKDIFAYNSIMKVKLKILECVNLDLSFFMLYLLFYNFVCSMFWS